MEWKLRTQSTTDADLSRKVTWHESFTLHSSRQHIINGQHDAEESFGRRTQYGGSDYRIPYIGNLSRVLSRRDGGNATVRPPTAFILTRRNSPQPIGFQLPGKWHFLGFLSRRCNTGHPHEPHYDSKRKIRNRLAKAWMHNALHCSRRPSKRNESSEVNQHSS